MILRSLLIVATPYLYEWTKIHMYTMYLYLCLCIYIYVPPSILPPLHTHTCIYVYPYTRIYVHTESTHMVWIYVYICYRIYIYICEWRKIHSVRVYLRVFCWIYLNISVYMISPSYLRMYICIYMYMCIYVPHSSACKLLYRIAPNRISSYLI